MRSTDQLTDETAGCPAVSRSHSVAKGFEDPATGDSALVADAGGKARPVGGGPKASVAASHASSRAVSSCTSEVQGAPFTLIRMSPSQRWVLAWVAAAGSVAQTRLLEGSAATPAAAPVAASAAAAARACACSLVVASATATLAASAAHAVADATTPSTESGAPRLPASEASTCVQRALRSPLGTKDAPP